MFINISNHPSVNWGEEQKNAAKRLGNCGDILDYPFPNVPATASKKDVDEMAIKVLEQIKNVSNTDVVHVMGEMGLTYRIVMRLQMVGIYCCYSTTERIVEMVGEEKRVRFMFTQFRFY